MADVEQAFEKAQLEGDGVLVEQFIAGDDHRLLVIDGRFVRRLDPSATARSWRWKADHR